MRNNPVSGMTIALALGGIALLGVGTYFLLAPSSQNSSTPAGTPVTQWTPGQSYTWGAADASSTTDVQTLVSDLKAGGFTNVSVWYFKGQGSIPSVLSGITTNGYAASGTFSGTSVSNATGVTAVTGVPTGLTALATG
jgi:hypothetical protein